MFPVFLLFFLSGFAALVYELLWFRHLGFIFGNTVYAATAVVTAYMAGLAFGAIWLGRNRARVRQPIRWFAFFELCIGLYALLAPALFGLIRMLYRMAYQQVSTSHEVLTPFRLFLALLVMALPTFLMGATLPLLSRGLVAREEGFGRRIGLLYGMNTLGAVSGLLAAGFFLIPTFGLRTTNLIAVGCNLAVAALAWLFAGRGASAADAAAPASATPSNAMIRRALWGTALAGFLALGFEVLWFRALILVFGSTTYSFSAMLATFLAGIGIGSVLFGGLCDRTPRPLAVLGIAQLVTGVYTLAMLGRFDHQPAFLIQHLIARGFEWRHLLEAQFAITAKFLAVPTLMMGLSFTAAAKALRHGYGDSARAVAAGYTWNTLGCVAGSLSAGFLLLPHLGMQHALQLLAVLAVAVGGVLLALSLPRRALAWGVGLGLPALAAASLVFARPWTRERLAAGAYFSPWNFVRDGKFALDERLNAEELLFYREGVTATASVTRNDDMAVYFSMDGKVEADTLPRGMVVQRMIGHLPMLFHPNPKTVMNLGLGAGCTFGSLSCYPVDHLEVVEIEPAVTNVARIWNAYNHAVIEQTNAIVTINDGRNHLFCTPIRYDVITSDPYEPVVGGASHLFTVEHFRQARERLKPDGIMCQWVPMYEMSRRDFLTILRSFVHVYPESALFFSGLDIVMLGFKDKVHLDLADVRRKYEIPKVRASLEDIGFAKPEMILGMFVSDMGRAAQLVGDGPLNTDNDPVIEFSTPKSAVHFTAEANQEVLAQNFTDLPEPLLAGLDEQSRALVTNEHAALRLALDASILRASNQTDQAFVLLKQANAKAPLNPVIRNELASMLVASGVNLLEQGNRQDAAVQLQYAVQMNPREFWALYHLVTLGMQGGNPAFAKATLEQALHLYPDSPLLWLQKAKMAFSDGNPAAAQEAIGQAIHCGPTKPNVWDEVARLQNALGRPLDAQSALEKAKQFREARQAR